MMKIAILGSGSKGNATLVEYDGFNVLVDAGLPEVQLCQRLNEVGKTPADIHAVFITHCHSDHISGLSLLQRATVYAEPETITGATTPAIPGRTVGVGNVSVTPFRAHHDKPTLGFIFDSGYHKLGYLTDTGHYDNDILRALSGSHTLIVESNYDDALLQAGPYPEWLKRRISGKHGHLSNRQAGELVKHCMWDGLERVILAHGSEKNNRPDVAAAEARKALGESVEIAVAGQHGITGPFMPGAVQSGGYSDLKSGNQDSTSPDNEGYCVTIEAETIHSENISPQARTENLLQQISEAERIQDLKGVASALERNHNPKVEHALRLKRRELSTMRAPASPWF
jgi:phosphoribosyl 1,2-cyclic phosphodiesterase